MGNETEVVYRQIEFAPVLTKIKKLQTDRRFRNSKKLFFAEGIRNFVEAVDNGFLIDTIIYSEKLLIAPLARKLVRQLKRKGIPFARASPEQFREISKTEKASGVAAIYHQKVFKISEIKPTESFCWTVLSDVRSLGNFGTLMRTSTATGADGFILIGDNIDPFDPNVVRATMGAIFKQNIVRSNVQEFGNWVKKHNLQVIGASPNAPVDYDRILYESPTILFLGNERKGLSEEEKQICRKLVKIPMVERVDSLNVAVAGSLLLYEVFRKARRDTS